MAEAYHKFRTKRAPAPSGCPFNHSFTPFSADYMANPYAELERLRKDTPVFHSEKLGYLILTRMEDVSEVFRNPDTLSAENVQYPVLPICDAAEILSAGDYNPIAVMFNRARPDQTRICKYTLAGFPRRRMRLLEPFIRERCNIMVDAMLTTGSPAEFLASLGHLLPDQSLEFFPNFSFRGPQELWLKC